MMEIQAKEVIDYTIRIKYGIYEEVVYIGQSEDELLSKYAEIKEICKQLETQNNMKYYIQVIERNAIIIE